MAKRESDPDALKNALTEWKGLLIGTLAYHAERLQVNLESQGRTQLASLKNKFLAHPYVLKYKEKFGFDLEHFSHRLAGAVTHRNWQALCETLKSILKHKPKGPSHHDV